MRIRSPLAAVLLAACSGHADPSTVDPIGPTPIDVMPASTKVTRITNLIAQVPQRDAQKREAPWSLTAPDGSGLALTRVDGKAVVEGPLAFTELHLYFHNPEDRRREGTFSITLPQGAVVSRFAMENEGQLQEAEVVEKQLARRAYEDFLHRRQDPALLEKAEGNQFSARVFPILPKADKHIVISFSQQVTPGHYALPLRGLAKVDQVDIRVDIRGKDGGMVEQTVAERNWLPDRDVVVDGSTVGAPDSVVAGELVAARVKLELPQAAEPPTGVTILVDTSASRALGFDALIKSVRQLVGELGRDYGTLPIQIVAFDQTTQSIFDGRADQLGDIESAFAARGALGASDLGQALAWLGDNKPLSRVLIVTDGVVTAGASGDDLAKLAKGIKGVERIDVALAGGIRDEQTAGAVAHAGLAHAGAVLDLDKGTTEVAHRMGLAVNTDVPIAVDGARWVFPHAIAAAQSGDEITVFARRDVQHKLTVAIAGARVPLSPVAVSQPLLSRAVAGAEIAELDGKLASAKGEDAAKLRKDIAARSVENRIVSSQTSMLVLETDADYARFGIDRRALADILEVGPTGIELHHRAARPAQIAQESPPKKKNRIATETRKTDQVRRDDSPVFHDEDEDPAQARADAIEQARTAGVLGANQQGQAGDISSGFDGTDGHGARMALAEGKMGRRDEDSTWGTDTRRGSGPGGGGSVAASPPPPPPPPSPTRIAVAHADAPPPRAELARIESRLQELRTTHDDGLDRSGPALTGPLAEVARALATGDSKAALAKASAWHVKEPGDVLALIALGDSLEATHDTTTAARVYGSIIDLYPARADFRRFAGERLERLGKPARSLIIDTYRRAVEQRPDHLTGHRLLAFELLRDGQYAEAFAAILAGLDERYPANRFAGAERVLREDAGMIGAAYIAQSPARRAEVVAELAKRGTGLVREPSTRFLMYWETDANDVDFHIRDARGGHAWYSHKQLESGGELYADITTGYGPECFSIPGTPHAGPYQLSINYYSQGPMGYGMGLLQIERYDGKGHMTFEDRPYVIMTDHAFVNLGTYKP
jgi:hypothetical protein